LPAFGGSDDWRRTKVNESNFPLWLPICIVALWLFVGATLAYISRWPTLAARYPGADRPSGYVLRSQVTSVGWVGENNVTYLIASPAGLYIYSMFLFRFMRPPILVPWREVEYESSSRFLWARTYKLRLAGVTTISVKEKGFRELQPYLPTVPYISPE
jgi:hypothetical protein